MLTHYKGTCCPARSLGRPVSTLSLGSERLLTYYSPARALSSFSSPHIHTPARLDSTPKLASRPRTTRARLELSETRALRSLSRSLPPFPRCLFLHARLSSSVVVHIPRACSRCLHDLVFTPSFQASPLSPSSPTSSLCVTLLCPSPNTPSLPSRRHYYV